MQISLACCRSCRQLAISILTCPSSIFNTNQVTMAAKTSIASQFPFSPSYFVYIPSSAIPFSSLLTLSSYSATGQPAAAKPAERRVHSLLLSQAVLRWLQDLSAARALRWRSSRDLRSFTQGGGTAVIAVGAKSPARTPDSRRDRGGIELSVRLLLYLQVGESRAGQTSPHHVY